MKRQRISPRWRFQALRRWVTGRAPADEPRLILRDSDTAFVWLPGTGTRLVLVFLGIQRKWLRHKRLDFLDIASQQGRNHVLFVSDLSRGWYSRPGQRDRITAAIRRFVGQHGIQSISTMGGSMGGYGAILFGSQLPARDAIAFVPQVLVSEDIIGQPEWAKYRPAILSGVERDLTPMMARTTCRFHVVIGDKDPDDIRQFAYLRQTLPDANNVRVLIAPGQKHGVGPWLKAQGQLERLVTALWAGDRQELEDCSKALERPLDLTLA